MKGEPNVIFCVPHDTCETTNRMIITWLINVHLGCTIPLNLLWTHWFHGESEMLWVDWEENDVVLFSSLSRSESSWIRNRNWNTSSWSYFRDTGTLWGVNSSRVQSVIISQVLTGGAEMTWSVLLSMSDASFKEL